MSDRERILSWGLIVLLITLAFGFLVEEQPRFAGSLGGSLIGIAGALLMLASVLYTPVRRIGAVKRLFGGPRGLRAFLTFHIYAGLIGPILGLIHTGRRFEHGLGIALTALMLATALSGYIGRYILSRVAEQLRDKKELLHGLSRNFDELLESDRPAEPVPRNFLVYLGWQLTPWRRHDGERPPRPHDVAAAIADVKSAIAAYAAVRAAFRRWLILHIVLSIALMILLGLHIWQAFYFGLRWLPL
ncbi:hypothetical protein CXZ10_01000 [Pleomorphomonas diazotrophica]|uniref:Iron reductase n=1 Tax=Pleomorphomonas diazotrophica TaxID=1166257 RepID=A0A1I4VCX9_9HYPH|nr:hypothetical protein [Pleomorphomonas diazotrophica]PKR90002.1 hypothetical protein CXZ10_01000 [Pleomorphomonas diazotrophica]SFM99046.1 hypothetical protein SAMN05192571_11111 [Pleomorphomonas diazotrophica]